jgi:hypothetical protein
MNASDQAGPITGPAARPRRRPALAQAMLERGDVSSTPPRRESPGRNRRPICDSRDSKRVPLMRPKAVLPKGRGWIGDVRAVATDRKSDSPDHERGGLAFVAVAIAWVDMRPKTHVHSGRMSTRENSDRVAPPQVSEG